MTASGVQIAFEGIDGSGKTTTVGYCSEWLHSMSEPNRVAKEPWRAKLRDIQQLRSEQDELELALQDREQHFDAVISPALEQGAFVVQDRSWLSIPVYHSLRWPGQTFDETRAKASEIAVQCVKKFRMPELVVFLSIRALAAHTRIVHRGGVRTEYEKQPQKLQRAIDLYKAVLEVVPRGRLLVVDVAPSVVCRSTIASAVWGRFLTEKSLGVHA